MELQIGRNIHSLRCRRRVSQEDLAQAMGVTVQAVSKWENGKANPDLMLLPGLADYFGVTIDSLFAAHGTDILQEDGAAQTLEHNSNWWAGIADEDLKTTALPNYGFFTPTEDTLCLFGDVRGKNMLELACGRGESLVWLNQKGARECWGLDISSEQIKRAGGMLEKKGVKEHLFVSPMEHDPGLPHGYFDFVFSIYGIGWTMDLDKTVILVSEYLKPGGRVIFAWDNPLMQCIASKGGKYVLTRSYVAEEDILFCNHDEVFRQHNWKLSTYLNCLADHGFLIEKVVEESSYDEKEAAVFREGKIYSADRARMFNPSFIIKARKS